MLIFISYVLAVSILILISRSNDPRHQLLFAMIINVHNSLRCIRYLSIRKNYLPFVLDCTTFVLLLDSLKQIFYLVLLLSNFLWKYCARILHIGEFGCWRTVDCIFFFFSGILHYIISGDLGNSIRIYLPSIHPQCYWLLITMIELCHCTHWSYWRLVPLSLAKFKIH